VAACTDLAVAICDGDCADEPVVVQVHHDPGARAASGLQGVGAEQRIDVVGVHDLRLVAFYGGADIRRCLTARQHCERRADAPAPARERSARTLEELRPVAVRAQQRRHLGDRPLLAARLAVAVVHEQD
jgi:hypothetical protein